MLPANDMLPPFTPDDAIKNCWALQSRLLSPKNQEKLRTTWAMTMKRILTVVTTGRSRVKAEIAKTICI